MSWGFNSKSTAEKAASITRQSPPSTSGQAPTVIAGRTWVIKPKTDIPAIDASTAGMSTDCEIYWIDVTDGSIQPHLGPPSEGGGIPVINPAVFNIGETVLKAGKYYLAVQAAGAFVAVGGGFSCDDLCDCDLFAEDPACNPLACCGPCDDFPEAAITLFTSNTSGTSWTQSGPSVLATNCAFDVPLSDGASGNATIRATMGSGWILDLTNIGGEPSVLTTPSAGCSGTISFDDGVSSQGSFEMAGSQNALCICCGDELGLNPDGVACNCGDDPISNLSTTTATVPPATRNQVGASVRDTENLCSWILFDDAGGRWNVRLTASGLWGAGYDNGDNYAQNNTVPALCAGLIELEDVSSPGNIVTFNVNCLDGCATAEAAAQASGVGSTLRQMSPELFPSGRCAACTEAATLMDLYGPERVEAELDRFARQFHNVTRRPIAEIRDKIRAAIKAQ